MLWLAVATGLLGTSTTSPVEATGVERAASRTIFLDRSGPTLTPGTNDSTKETSSIVKARSQLTAYAGSDDDWDEIVNCMRDVWSRFDVTITDVDPGSTPHMQAVFTGSSAQVGLASNVTGISPFASDCGVVENSIAFTFTDKLPKSPRRICEVMSQEVGHSYGLDHELIAASPMSYLSYTGDREFQDVDAQCGENTPRPCGNNGCRASQNSVQVLLARLGEAGGDDVAPAITVMSPLDDAIVFPGFSVEIHASDNVAVSGITLFVDGIRTATSSEASPVLATSPDMALGAHTLRIEAVDDNGNLTKHELTVTTKGDLSFGCSTGSGLPAWPVGVALLALRRRRARQ